MTGPGARRTLAQMKRTLLVVAVALCMLPAVAVADTETKVTMSTYNGGEGKFFGEVESPRKRCKDDRKVTVYRRVAGPDVKVGSDESKHGPGDTYSWTVKEETPVFSDPYYAKAKPKGDCAGDRSKDFIFP